jgi:putative Mn2+ efflux pump MntP
MSLFEIFLLAVGLAMDAFAVSAASGIAMRNFFLARPLFCDITKLQVA